MSNTLLGGKRSLSLVSLGPICAISIHSPPQKQKPPHHPPKHPPPQSEKRTLGSDPKLCEKPSSEPWKCMQSKRREKKKKTATQQASEEEEEDDDDGKLEKKIMGPIQSSVKKHLQNHGRACSPREKKSTETKISC
jgi:hypothetical protein